MKTIAIELNHVVRNINKQLIKYYKRNFDNSLDDENIDEVNKNFYNSFMKTILMKYLAVQTQ